MIRRKETLRSGIPLYICDFVSECGLEVSAGAEDIRFAIDHSERLHRSDGRFAKGQIQQIQGNKSKEQIQGTQL